MTKYDYEEHKKKVELHLKKVNAELSIRYKKAFDENKINWLRVKFHPVSPEYVEEKKEQVYLAEYGFGREQPWRPNTHYLEDNNNDPKLKKLIEKEKELSDQYYMSPFGTLIRKVQFVKTKKKKSNEKPINLKNPVKKRLYRD